MATTPNSKSDLEKELNLLRTEVADLHTQFRQFNSFRRNFSVAIVRGFASALGATVVFGLALASLIQIVRSIDYVPILNDILNSGAIEEIIKRFASQV